MAGIGRGFSPLIEAESASGTDQPELSHIQEKGWASRLTPSMV